MSLSFIQEELAAFRKERREAHEADLDERQADREANQRRWEADRRLLESLLRQRGLLHPDDQAS